ELVRGIGWAADAAAESPPMTAKVEAPPVGTSPDRTRHGVVPSDRSATTPPSEAPARELGAGPTDGRRRRLVAYAAVAAPVGLLVVVGAIASKEWLGRERPPEPARIPPPLETFPPSAAPAPAPPTAVPPAVPGPPRPQARAAAALTAVAERALRPRD